LEFVEIDGSLGEGGGQILRTSLSLATIFGKPIRISKIRAGRREPGLRPQHLHAVLVSSKISGGRVQGAKVGSTEIEYVPGSRTDPFRETVDVGTAGSIGLIAQTIIPISLFKNIELDLQVVGGTEVPNSPTIDYLQRLVVPIYEKLGAKIEIAIMRRGYYPKGGGLGQLKCRKTQSPNPLTFPETVEETNPEINVLSVSRNLPDHVCQRQAMSAKTILQEKGFERISINLDSKGQSLSPGSSILVSSSTVSTFVGSSSLGDRGKRAEVVGEEAAQHFLREIENFPNVDSNLADMLITLLCCVPGKSVFRTSLISEHFRTNAEVAEKLAGSKIEFQKDRKLWRVDIEGSPEKAN
jgi:RNA 3'-phosphate cyclase